jgi:hypothetical protein
VLSAAFDMTILAVISCVHLATFVIMLPKKVKYSTSPVVFICNILHCDGYLDILITLIYSSFTSIPQHLPILISLSNISCSIVSSFASKTVYLPISQHKLLVILL